MSFVTVVVTGEK